MPGPLKLLNIIDEFNRECLASWSAARSTPDNLVVTLDELAAERGAPAYLRTDDGTEFLAYALADWCRSSKTGTTFIDPGCPWQNPGAESFNGSLRDELA